MKLFEPNEPLRPKELELELGRDPPNELEPARPVLVEDRLPPKELPLRPVPMQSLT